MADFSTAAFRFFGEPHLDIWRVAGFCPAGGFTSSFGWRSWNHWPSAAACQRLGRPRFRIVFAPTPAPRTLSMIGSLNSGLVSESRSKDRPSPSLRMPI